MVDYSYLCEYLYFTRSQFVFACSFRVCAHLSSIHVSMCMSMCERVYACFSVLLWDCRTISRVLNNESKHWRGAKSHCTSLSLCTALTSAVLL